MPKEQREAFERRLLALVRHQLDELDEDYPDGWEISDFVVTARFYWAPEPGTQLNPWAGGAYPGWNMNAWTGGSSTSNLHDAELLADALEYSRRWHEHLRQQAAAEYEDQEAEGFERFEDVED